MVIGLTVAVVVLAAGAVALSILFVRTFHQKQALLQELQANRQTFRDLRDQKDVLMARLVALQGPSAVAESGAAPEPPEEAAEAPSESEEADMPGPDGEKHPASSAAVGGQTLDVSEFSVKPLPESRGLKIRFKIRNKRKGGGATAGYTFVLLKPGGGVEADRWRVLPDTPLAGEKPAVVRKGQYFSISNYIFQTFRVDAVDAPERYATATVAVFDKEGRTLLSRDFELKLAAWPASTSAPKDAAERGADGDPPPADQPAAAAAGAFAAANAEPSAAAAPAALKAAGAWPSELPYSIHTGSFTRREQAEKRARTLAEMAYDSFVISAQIPGKGRYYRVFVGRFKDRTGADTVLQDMKTRQVAESGSRIVARSWALP